MNIFKRVFIAETNNVLIQLIRYAFVGGIAFVADYGTLIALTEFCGIHYILSATAAFILGLVVNYLISIVWVFRKSEFSSRVTEFLAYALIGVIGLGLTLALMYLFTDIIGINYAISKLIVVAMVYAWNFFARRYLIFNGK